MKSLTLVALALVAIAFVAPGGSVLAGFPTPINFGFKDSVGRPLPFALGIQPTPQGFNVAIFNTIDGDFFCPPTPLMVVDDNVAFFTCSIEGRTAVITVERRPDGELFWFARVAGGNRFEGSLCRIFD